MLTHKLISQGHVFVVLFMAANVAAVSVPDPIALYPLNGKYETREINNRLPQGTPVGVSLAAGPNGKAGGSYQFAGQANSYIEFPNNGGLDAKHSITMLCWIYPEKTGGPIFNYHGTAGLWGVHFWTILDGKLFALFPQRDYKTPPYVVSDQVLELNQWYFVGASYDHNTGLARLWLDGKQIAELDIGAGMTLATQDDVRMGVKEDDDRYFKGRITAMQVYDVALTSEQIDAVKNVGQDVNECSANSVACYNGGKCVVGGNGYTCDCQPGYIGQHCEWQKKGCWKEVKSKKDKAMGRVYDKFKKNKNDVQAAVEACLKSAEESKLQIFGVRNKYMCVTTKKGSTDFRVHGASKNCKERKDYGVGVKNANYVYILKKSK